MAAKGPKKARRDDGMGERAENVDQRSFRGEEVGGEEVGDEEIGGEEEAAETEESCHEEIGGEEEAAETEESCHEEVLIWDDVCPAANRIEKIAEASYAEVYRVSNEQGTSIIKVIRLESPIRPQTKAQQRSGLVDEEPHSEEDMRGELSISEWLSDIPGFVVYKERFIVKGKAPKALLDTHQAFHRRMKRKDPDRLQFYPSPSRYLDETRFLVVELGDAGTSLEDFEVTSISQVWDIILHTALALARAEDLIEFEASLTLHCLSLPTSSSF
jgi:serine/threonine-protein kinase haspin